MNTNTIILDREVKLYGYLLEIGPDHIRPEVDIMECMKKEGQSEVTLKNTVHYGYGLNDYQPGEPNNHSGGP
jgi:hypothetical protein